jgi:hypothetical protein
MQRLAAKQSRCTNCCHHAHVLRAWKSRNEIPWLHEPIRVPMTVNETAAGLPYEYKALAAALQSLDHSLCSPGLIIFSSHLLTPCCSKPCCLDALLLSTPCCWSASIHRAAGVERGKHLAVAATPSRCLVKSSAKKSDPSAGGWQRKVRGAIVLAYTYA